jgi:hypothetical protein
MATITSMALRLISVQAFCFSVSKIFIVV